MPKSANIYKILFSHFGHIPIALAVLLAFLLSSSIASSECGEVTKNPVPSSRNVRITVFADGKLLQGATIEVSQADKGPLFTVSTDDHGVAELPPLKLGLYSLVRAFSEDLHSDLYLHVLEGAESKASVFPMDLKPTGTAQLLATAAKMPVSERIQEFKGTVEDQAGTGVPRALIKVFPRESKEKTKGIYLKADENGRFSTPLPDGTYTALVQSQGFRTWLLVLK